MRRLSDLHKKCRTDHFSPAGPFSEVEWTVRKGLPTSRTDPFGRVTGTGPSLGFVVSSLPSTRLTRCTTYSWSRTRPDDSQGVQ